MTFKYRCSRCRTRCTFRRPLSSYVREKKCHHCGHPHFYWDRERNGRRRICGCEGYHFTHRWGSRMCIHNPYQELHLRQRQGEDGQDVFAEITLEGRLPGYTDAEPPF